MRARIVPCINYPHRELERAGDTQHRMEMRQMETQVERQVERWEEHVRKAKARKLQQCIRHPCTRPTSIASVRHRAGLLGRRKALLLQDGLYALPHARQARCLDLLPRPSFPIGLCSHTLRSWLSTTFSPFDSRNLDQLKTESQWTSQLAAKICTRNGVKKNIQNPTTNTHRG